IRFSRRGNTVPFYWVTVCDAMKVVIAGGSGFLGQALARRLAAGDHEVVVLSRGTGVAPSGRVVQWMPDGSAGSRGTEIDGAHAIINLAGESIAGSRWTDRSRRRIHESRLLSTRSLTEALRGARSAPPVFVSGSAVGYYGPLRDEIATEDRPPGSDF